MSVLPSFSSYYDNCSSTTVALQIWKQTTFYNFVNYIFMILDWVPTTVVILDGVLPLIIDPLCRSPSLPTHIVRAVNSVWVPGHLQSKVYSLNLCCNIVLFRVNILGLGKGNGGKQSNIFMRINLCNRG